MPNITLEAILAKLPMMKLTETIELHILPLLQLLPDKRLRAVVIQMIVGILGSQTPVITEMAGSNSKREGKTWAVAKRIYRLISNRRVSTGSFYQGLYASGQQVVERENPDYLVVAVDPVNFEKPYATSGGGGQHGVQSNATRPEWESAFGAWLSGDHGDGGQYEGTGDDVCRLVFV